MRGTETPEGRWELSTVTTGLGDGGRLRPPADERELALQYRVLQTVLSIASVGGYGALSVAVITRTSGVSRRGFNTWFSSPQEAFVVAHDRCMAQLVHVVRSAVEADGVPEQQLRQGLQAAVEYLVADPARADAVLMEVHAAGHRAQRSQQVAVEALVSEAHTVLARLGFDDLVTGRLARLGIGALREGIRARMARGELHTLPFVADELVDAAFPLRSLDPETRRRGAASTPSLLVA